MSRSPEEAGRYRPPDDWPNTITSPTWSPTIALSIARETRQAHRQVERMAFVDSDPVNLDPNAGWLSADDWGQNSQSGSGFLSTTDGHKYAQDQHGRWEQGSQNLEAEKARVEREAVESRSEFADATTFNMDWYNLEGEAAEDGGSSDTFAVPQMPALSHAFADYDWEDFESPSADVRDGVNQVREPSNPQSPEQAQFHGNHGNGNEGSPSAHSSQSDLGTPSEPHCQILSSTPAEGCTRPEVNQSKPQIPVSTPGASSSRPKRRKPDATGRGKVTAARNVNKSRKLKCDTCKEGAKRAAEYIPGEYDDLTLCDRHQKAWTARNGEIIWWKFQHWDPHDAVSRIRPDFEPPEAYTDPEYFDQTFWENCDKADEWSRRFLDAIQTPYVYDGEGEPDKHSRERKLLDHQMGLRFRARSRQGKEDGFQYHEDMVNARVTLLFHIALRFHSGGKAVYCAGGDNWGFREATSLTFLKRLETIEHTLRENKRVAMDVIEGRGVEALVKNPIEVQKRKSTNDRNNPKREAGGGGDGANDAVGASRAKVGLVHPRKSTVEVLRCLLLKVLQQTQREGGQSLDQAKGGGRSRTISRLAPKDRSSYLNPRGRLHYFRSTTPMV